MVLVGKSEVRRPFGRPRHRWEDNVEMDFQVVGWVTWAGLIWHRIGTGGGLL
jgi:3-oxoacyl-ACP reductase-like protein